MTRNTEGVHLISPQTCNSPKADVVFVHGLGGTSHDTWTFRSKKPRTQFFWPEELANDLPWCRVWTVGYPAGVTQLGAPGMRIEKRAGNLAQKLANKGIGNKPIVFITHSMGGLIVKSLVAEAEAQGDDDRKRIANAVRGIVFCATPHRGSAYASCLKALGRYYSKPQDHVAEMIANSESIDLLHDRFVEWQRKYSIPLDTYAENQKLLQRRLFFRLFAPIGQVVERSSANTGIAGFATRDVDEDHISIAKPKNKDSDVYAGVLRFIQKLFVDSDNGIIPSTPIEEHPNIANNNDEALIDPAMVPIRSVDLAVAHIAPDDNSAEIWATALVVSDEADRLHTLINDWRQKLLNDPLQMTKYPVHRNKLPTLSDLAKDPVLLTRLLTWVTNTHFSAYVYYWKPGINPTHPPANDINKILIIEPISHRLSKKSEIISAVHSNIADIESLLKAADDLIFIKYHRRSRYSIGEQRIAKQKPLAELAQLIAEATVSHLSNPDDAAAGLLFEHLRTRIRYGKNIATGENHTRDKNPFP